MTRLYVIFALSFLIIGLLLVTGCDYVPNHDIILIKVTSTGTLDWLKIIDNGRDDRAGAMIPISDGGILIHMKLSNRSSLMRLSSNGSTVWDRDYVGSGCLDNAITQVRDGDFVTASSGLGAVCKIDKDGNLIWNVSSVKFDRLEHSQVYSIIETNDGGFLITGDSPGLFRLDSEGRLLNNTNSTMETILLDTDGKIKNQKTPLNATGRCITTFDGGFFCAGLQSNEGEKSINPFEGRETKVIGKKLDTEGILIWEQPVATFCRPKYRDNIELTSIIQTSDGGYVIVGARDNAWECCTFNCNI